jgi:hypothetical protein
MRIKNIIACGLIYIVANICAGQSIEKRFPVNTTELTVLENNEIVISTYGALLDINGNEKFSLYINQAEILVSCPTTDKCILMCGIHSQSEGFVLFKSDTNGNVVWKKTFHDSLSISKSPYGCVSTPDSGAIIFGRVEDSAGWKYFAFKIDISGNLVWSKKINIPELYPPKAIVTGDGAFVLVVANYILKLNSAGDYLWSKQIQNSFNVSCISEDPQGKYTIGDGGNFPSYIFQLDTNGSLISSKSISIGIGDLCFLKDSSMVIFFITNGSSSSTDYKFAHVDYSGHIISAVEIPGFSTNTALDIEPWQNGYAAIGNNGFMGWSALYATNNPDQLACAVPLPATPIITPYQTTVDSSSVTLQSFGFIDADSFNVIQNHPSYPFFCGTTNISDLNNEQLNIFPNPAENEVEIQTDYKSECQIILMDIFGRNVYQNNFQTGDFRIDVSSLKKGIYFIRLNGHNLIQQGKLIKE